MSQLEERTTGATHEVFNQSVPLEGYNVFAADRVLVEALEREGGEWAAPRARELGEVCGRPDVLHRGALANENPPKLRTHDRFGNRIDEVEFHPSWHELMRLGVGEGLHALPWREPKPGAHVARGALFMLLTQVEAGGGRPVSVSYPVVPGRPQQAPRARRGGQRVPPRPPDR